MTRSILDVSLYLRGYDLDPNQITEILNFEPTKKQKRGDIYTSPSTGQQCVRQIGFWRYLVQVESNNLVIQINSLLSILESNNFDLKKLDNVEELFIDVFLAKDIEDDSVTFEFDLSLDIIQRIAKLGLSLRFELCGVED